MNLVGAANKKDGLFFKQKDVILVSLKKEAPMVNHAATHINHLTNNYTEATNILH